MIIQLTLITYVEVHGLEVGSSKVPLGAEYPLDTTLLRQPARGVSRTGLISRVL